MPALVAGIHVFDAPLQKAWMAGTSPAMTIMSFRPISSCHRHCYRLAIRQYTDDYSQCTDINAPRSTARYVALKIDVAFSRCVLMASETGTEMQESK
jgi:hypothetical protein